MKNKCTTYKRKKTPENIGGSCFEILIPSCQSRSKDNQVL